MVVRVPPTVSRRASVDHGFDERRERFGHVEAALVDRTADDDAGEAAVTGAQPGERTQVVERARRRRSRSSGMPLAASTAPSWPNAGPSSVPSRPISVTMSAASPIPSNRSASVTRSAPEPSTQPRIATSLPRASRPTAMRPGYSWQSSSTSAGRSTAAVPTTTRSTPGVEQLQGRVGRAHAAAHLDLAGDAAHDQADLLEVRHGSPVRAASRSTTWIHWAPRGLELAGDAHGVVVVDGLGVEVALAQAHAVAAPQVDGGEEVRDRRPGGIGTIGAVRACPWSTARWCLRSSPRRAARGRRP